MDADSLAAERRRQRTFKKFTYRGVEVSLQSPSRFIFATPQLTQRPAPSPARPIPSLPAKKMLQLSALLDLDTPQLMELVTARARRRFQRGLKRKPMALIKKLRKAKKDAPAGEKPEVVKTHLRDMMYACGLNWRPPTDDRGGEGRTRGR